MTRWLDWHEQYEQPGSSLARRLEVVRARLRTALERVGPSPTILSLCSGDGRDVLGVLRDRRFAVGRAVLVESDRNLVARARRAAARDGLSEVEVRWGDAGATASFVDILPVDVLLLCGVFGNVEHASVRTVVDSTPGLVRGGGYVIWTRGGSAPDRRPEIRSWFSNAGLEEIAFDGAPEPYGVGLSRVTLSWSADGLPARLFSFA